MIQDLHAHTYYSFCGGDTPDRVIAAAIDGGIELLGISDHNYGIGVQRGDTVFPDKQARLEDYRRALARYRDHLALLQEKYRDCIRLLAGIEIATINHPSLLLPDELDAAAFDFCLLEHIDQPDTVATDVFAYARRCRCPRVGIAHTDIPTFLDRTQQDALAFFSRMAEQRMFWEMNVNYDSIHGYREHAYVQRVFTDESLQEILRKSGVELSVGFDGHRVGDYRPDRVTEACEKLEALGLPLVSWDE